MRQTSPEVRTHLAMAAGSLMNAAAGLLATRTDNQPRPGVEKIDLDDASGLGRRPMSAPARSASTWGAPRSPPAWSTSTGQLLATERTESPAKHPTEIVRTIGGLVERLRRDVEVEAVGVSAAGFVDKARATVLFAPNLAWRDEPLKDLLEKETGLPVVVENDANAAAWGEFTVGAGADIDDLLMLTIGTGVGGGVVLDGELMRGGFGIGAEVGHIRMVPDGVPCGCGNNGLPGVLRLRSRARTALARGGRA